MFSVNCAIISNAVASIQQSSHEAKNTSSQKYIINLSHAFPVSNSACFASTVIFFGVLVYGKFCNVEKNNSLGVFGYSEIRFSE